MRKLAAVLLLCACASQPAIPVAPAVTPPNAVTQQREQELAVARANYEKAPDDADAIIWYGRRTAYLGRYREAIEIFTEGVRKHPGDARMLRHRGHRWITLRELDRAIEDLGKAGSMIRGTEDQIEPDGMPNARNIPTSTLQSNIWYHLGLAHYLRGDFENALAAFRDCLTVSKNPDGVVSASHWLYMIHRRMGNTDEAEKVLEPISTDMDVIENQAYHKLLLMYRGEIAPEELVGEADAAIQYGVGNWYLYNGQPELARLVFQRIVAERDAAAFGTIAAEAELKRVLSPES